MRSKSEVTNRLLLALNKFNLPALNHRDLYEAVDVYMGDHVSEYLNLLDQHKSPVHQHHFVEIGNHRLFKQFDQIDYDHLNLAYNLTEAVAFVFNRFDISHIYPDQVIRHKNALEYLLDGEMLIKIGAINIEHVNQENSKELRECFKGIQSLGDEAKLVQRLTKIKGLERLRLNKSYLYGEDQEKSIEQFRTEHRRKYSMINMTENLGPFLRKMLSEAFDVEIKMSLALEIVADIFGNTDWNRFKSMADTYQLTVNHPVAIVSVENNISQINYYKNNCDAIQGMIDIVSRDKEYLAGNAVFELSIREENSVELKLFKPDGLESGYIASMFTPEFANSEMDFYYDWLAGLNIRSLDDAENIISSHFIIGGSFSKNLMGSNKRLEESTLIIKNILFTKNLCDDVRIQTLNSKQNKIIKLEGGREDSGCGYFDELVGNTVIYSDDEKETCHLRPHWKVLLDISHFSKQDLSEAAQFIGATVM